MTEAFGPIQVLVVGFDDGTSAGEILRELRRPHEHDVVRVVDLLVVTKDDQGNVVPAERSDVAEADSAARGAIARALIGYGTGADDALGEQAEAGALTVAALAEHGLVADDDVWYIADAVPDGGSAAVALIDHRWAIRLRDAIVRAGGLPVTDQWLHPRDLAAAGMADTE